MSHGIVEKEDAVAIYGHEAWHGLQYTIPLPTDGVPRSLEVLAHHAKLIGWNLKRQSLFSQDEQGSFSEVPGYKATVRTDVNRVLGVHGDRYTFFPNEALLEFARAVQGDALPNSAGSLFGGKLVFMCLDMGEHKVLGRTVHDYLVIVNTHDAESQIKSVVTPIEAVCANTVRMGIQNARRSWSCRHVHSIEEKAREASYTLQLNNAYFAAYKAEAERLAAVNIGDFDIERIISNLFPFGDGGFDAESSKVRVDHVMVKRNAFKDALASPDLRDFRMTGWGLVQAAADYESHYKPNGSKRGFEARRFAAVLGTDTSLVDKTVALIDAL